MSKVRKAVIPAAGFGTRFLPATKSMPKEMLPIIDKPAIHYAVEEAVKAGITDIIFVTGRGKRALEDYFDHSYELEDLLKEKGKVELLKSIEYISDMADIVYIRQKHALGLGHAVLRAKDFVGNEPFALILPDVFMDPDQDFLGEMVDISEREKASVIGVQVVPEAEVEKYGIVVPAEEGDVFALKGVVEKPKKEEAPSNLSIFGRYILSPEIFDYIEKTEPGAGGEIQITDAIEAMIKDQRTLGALYKGDYFDTGDKLGFLKATVCMGLKHEKLKKDFKEFLKQEAEDF